MKLLTKALEKRFAALGNQDGKGDDAIVVAKFFNPTGSWTWYATEWLPEQNAFCGLVDGDYAELGYFSKTELDGFKGPFGIGIERDLHFGEKTIGEVKKNLNGISVG